MKVSIRKITFATDKDNQDLLLLTRLCPMGGDIKVYTDRSPNFMAVYNLIDEKSFIILEHRNNLLSGCVGSTHRKLIINDKEYTIAFWGDLKVAPEFRKGLSAARLMNALMNSEKNLGTKLAIGSIVKGNKDSLILTEGRAGIPKGYLLENFKLYNIVPFFKLKNSNEFKISKATKADIPEIVQLYNQYYKNYNLAPEFTESGFTNMVNTFPGLSIDKFMIARKNDKIEAILACWDQTKLQKYIILKYNLSIRLMRILFRLLAPLMKMPEIPQKNKPLNFIYVCFLAAKNNNPALKAILRSVHNKIRGSGYSYFSVCMNEQDKMSDTIRGMIYSSVTSNLFAFSLDENKDIESYNLNNKPIHAEYALLI